ncbi:hypothetical protein J7K55_03015 [Candidatus Aerophobetes bacterium]|nr:hypothetical protein [Candidatus Aerophobetes bacterium]
MINITPSQPSEWGKAQVVALYRPNIETLFDILKVNSANFLYPFDLKKGQEKHNKFREFLNKNNLMKSKLVN